MSNSFIFTWTTRNRQNIQKYFENLPEQHRTTVPQGFNNNLHWQIGHIVTVTDGIVYGFAGKEPKLPKAYSEFFGPGTKPAEWNGEPPAWDEIIKVLNEQPEQLREVFADQLDTPVGKADNFAGAKVINDLLELNLSHESSHSGMINAMSRLLKQG
ncbi:DinB family protein [Paenibacillus shenyangensis]|uniref:DinB family protein n=1 Tax=Paenibacillus sp. A9 TaxID=1284352 RepID=UPI00037C8387|nr:DinB family protein [Paenibacillus sp. A9]